MMPFRSSESDSDSDSKFEFGIDEPEPFQLSRGRVNADPPTKAAIKRRKKEIGSNSDSQSEMEEPKTSAHQRREDCQASRLASQATVTQQQLETLKNNFERRSLCK